MMSQRIQRDDLTREHLLSNYGHALALTADATPEEKARAMKTLGLDEAGLLALTAEADAAVGQAIEADDVASLLAFKSAFDGGRKAMEKARAAKLAEPPPPPLYAVKSSTPPAPADGLAFPRRRRPAKPELVAVPPPLPAAPSSYLAIAVRPRPVEKTPEETPVVREVVARGFTLMQYAALRADVINSAEHARASVFARYGLTEEEDLRVATAWNERFGADRSLFQQYLQLFNYFRGLARR